MQEDPIQQCRIVIVDDDRLIAEGFGSLLATTTLIDVVGYATNGFTAVQLVEKLKPDLAIVDICLPGESGIDLAADLHRRSKGVRVIMCSAYSEELDVVRAIQAGAHGFVSKRSDWSDFVYRTFLNSLWKRSQP